MILDDRVYLLGIRHHGPGSAMSVNNALAEIQPEVILLEGPPELEPILDWLSHEEMSLPVAALLYDKKEVAHSVLYPFADYSPELQAIRYAKSTNIAVQMFDLPATHFIAQKFAQNDKNAPQAASIRTEDPIHLLAKAAGFEDSEAWWNFVVEQRENDLAIFGAIAEAMTAVREALESEQPESQETYIREAWMRKILRQTLSKHKGKIAVICGAWHVPALMKKVKVTKDNALIKGLAKCAIQSTWIPWTNERLTLESGYGAGIDYPGWYEHIWQHHHQNQALNETWLAKVANLLRKDGVDVSTASLIDAVRLADTLATLRGFQVPAIEEFNEAITTTFCFGDDIYLKLIRKKLLIGHRMGKVPVDAPKMALQQDFEQQLKTLRLKLSDEKELLLDLRKELHLKRSIFFHRLKLLGLKFAIKNPAISGKGTFKEAWKLKWEPEFAIDIVNASTFGNSILSAATQKTIQALENEQNIQYIIDLLSDLLFAELPSVIQTAMQKLQDIVAVNAELQSLMVALPGLVEISRYGNVRNTEIEQVNHLVRNLLPRICHRLPSACYAIDEEAAQKMTTQIERCDAATNTFAQPELLTLWQSTLSQLLDNPQIQGLIGGKVCRLLIDHQVITAEDAAIRLSYELSQGNEVEHEANWIQGLLEGAALLLIHHDRLWMLVDEWLRGIQAERFIELLPILRRAFSSFESGEIKQLLAKSNSQQSQQAKINLEPTFNAERAEMALVRVSELMGLTQ
jgi:hypothetical protein